MDLINGLELLSWMFSNCWHSLCCQEGHFRKWDSDPSVWIATNFVQIRAGRWKSGPGDEAEVWQCWGLPTHSTGFAAHTSWELLSTLITFRPSWIQNRPRALSTRVLLVFCTPLGPIYLMVFIRAVLMPQNYTALLNFAVVGETIIKVVWQIPW